ncbi:MAG: glycogen synthase GlgA, partial [Ignavibacteriaceae bacterium]
TGFAFAKYDGKELLRAFRRATRTFRNTDTWRKIQVNGMLRDYSWEHSAKEYLNLYKKAKAKIIRASV